MSEVVLQKTLAQFNGAPLDKNKLNAYHIQGFGIFANPVFVFDPRIQFTTQLDITDIYENYKSNYKLSERVTFATFVKWIALKSMRHTPFTWRQINGRWFEFANLPLLVTMRTKQNRELTLYILENTMTSSWNAFCKLHEDYKDGKIPDVIHEVLEIPVHNIGYQMLNVHLPRMTSYNVTTRATYSHQPFIVFSDRYPLENKLYLPFYLNYSHATLTPEDAEVFVNQFLKYARMTPSEVEQTSNQAPSLLTSSTEPDPEPSDNMSF